MKPFVLFCLRYFVGFVLIASVGFFAVYNLFKVSDSKDEKVGQEQLTPYLQGYTSNVVWLSDRVESIVTSYSEDANAELNTDQLFMDWEMVAVHEAIEMHHSEIYTNIWATLIGFKTAIDQKAAIEEVQSKQKAFENALWQAMGALKMSAQYREMGIVESYYVQRDCSEGTAVIAKNTKNYFDRTVAKVCRVSR